LGTQGPTENELLAIEEETRLDTGLGGALAYKARVRARTQCHLERPDQHRLTRPGLTGYYGHPLAQTELSPFDNSKVFYDQLFEHLSPARGLRWELRPPSGGDGNCA
jgi:hypothetical protein